MSSTPPSTNSPADRAATRALATDIAECFGAAVEARVCEIVLGDRRHGQHLGKPGRPAGNG
jgi:hypothetical protein